MVVIFKPKGIKMKKLLLIALSISTVTIVAMDRSRFDTALINAVRANSIENAQKALESGASMNPDDDGTRSPNYIHPLVCAQSPEMVRLLVAYGARAWHKYQPFADENCLEYMAMNARLAEDIVHKERSINQITANRHVIRCIIQEYLVTYNIGYISKNHSYSEPQYLGLLIHTLQNGTSPFNSLVTAIDMANIELIESILTQHPELINYRDEFGCTPLAYALYCRYNVDITTVKSLLARGAHVADSLITYDLGLRDGVALHIAVQRNNTALATLLKQFGATAYQQGGRIDKPLEHASSAIAAVMAPEECPICLTPIHKMHTYPCGHIICRTCFEGIKDDRCPMCRAQH